MASRITATAVAVGTTPTLLLGPDIHRRVAWIHNAGAATIFVGPSDVTTLTGLPVLAGERLNLLWASGDQTVGEALYAIAAANQVSPDNTRVLAGNAQ